MKKVNYFPLAVTMTCMLTLAACTSESTSTGSADNNVSSTPEPEVPALEGATATMTVPKNFEFKTDSKFKVDVDISNVTDARGFLSLCHDYMYMQGTYKVNYESCMLRTPIVDGIYTGEVNIGHQHENVIAAIWFNDLNREPMFEEVNVASVSQQNLTLF